MAESGLTRTLPALAQLAQEYTFTLVDAEIVREGAARYLRIYIDKPGGITLDDCEVYHRAVSKLVEHLDYDFLEVCSPGLDRPLKKQADFDSHAGSRVELRLYRPIHGCKVCEGELIGLEDGVITLNVAGEVLRFEQKDVSLCRPVIEFDEDESAVDEEESEDAGGQG